MPDTADIVLFTVNDHETRETQAAFGKSKPAVPNGDYRYWHYGEIGGAQVVHAECSMADLPAGKAARSAMDVWKPGLLIAVGIAWGAKADKQAIGEILLADPLRDGANHADRDGKIEPRGQPFALPDNLRQIVKTCHRDWREAEEQSRPKLRIGEVISMPKLLDNSAERKRWVDALPEAIGGEMEGRGMVDAAVERKCDWLVLKAICDWGEGKNADEPTKESDQAHAAKNAATLLRFAVEHGLGALAASSRSPRTAAVATSLANVTMNLGSVSGTAIGSVGTLNVHQSALQPTVESYYRAIAQQRSTHTVVEVNATDNSSPDQPRADQIYVQPDVSFTERKEPPETMKSFAVDKLTAVKQSGPKYLQLQSCLSSQEAKFQRVVLTGTSGMGKTTAVNREVLALVHGGRDIPWIALRLPSLLDPTAQSNRDVQSALQIDIMQSLQCMREQAALIAIEIIRELDEKPGVMLFDALDEVPSTQRAQVLSALRLFIAERYAAQPTHRIVVTSRPYAYNGELEHEGFSLLALAPFTPQQVDALIDQYFSRVVHRPEVGAAMKLQVASARGVLSQKEYVDLLEEPMLATYACMLASENFRAQGASSISPESLPRTRFELFDGVVRLLLEKWEPTRADTKFAPLKPLFQTSAGNRSLLRTMLERAAYGQIAELSEHAMLDLKQLATLTHERLVAIVDELMPPTLPVRAYEVVRWLAERTAFLPAFSEHPTKRYQLHLQLGSFLAAGGLYAKAGNDDYAYVEALVTDFIRAPESLRQFVTMGLSKICDQPRVLVAAIESMLAQTIAMPEILVWETVGNFAIAFTDAVASAMWLNDSGNKLDQALEPLRTKLLELVDTQQLKAPDRNRAADALGTLGDRRFDAAAPHLMRHRYHDSPVDEPIPGFVRIPAGTFSMFDNDGRVSEPYPGTIKAPFYIARSLTTVQQYERFVNGGGYGAGKELWDAQGLAWRNGVFTSIVEEEAYKRWLARRPAPLRLQPWQWSAQLAHPSRPVTGVSWFEARAYCRWLDTQFTEPQRAVLRAQNNNNNYEVRLPTEVQWERATRASSLTMANEHRYPWGDDPGRITQVAYVRSGDIAIDHVSSVGVFLPNAIGLYDMASWAWQWMDNLQENSASAAHSNIEKDYAFATDEDEKKCERPALCGGSWFSRLLAYSHCRDGMLPGGCEWRVGFRVVLSQTQ